MSTVIATTGTHVLADLYGICGEDLSNADKLESLLRSAALEAGAQVLSSHFHSFGSEQGVTGVVLLAESHISIHTWPESGFAAVDIFMCGNAAPQLALRYLTQALSPSRQRVETTARGTST